MARRPVLAVRLISVAAACCALVVSGPAAMASSGPWGSAEQLPGIAALNAGGRAVVSVVSCPAAGYCAAAGYYTGAQGDQQVFVASETDGAWGFAREIPGTPSLNIGGGAGVTALSCGAVGDCSAGGYYSDGSDHRQAFVADESGGTWSDAQEAPGTATLNAGGYGSVTSLSCPSAGNCAAGGYYTDASRDEQAFVAVETDGKWGAATEVPGTAAANAGGYAEVNSVSCPSAGTCVAGGLYTDASLHSHAFVTTQAKGTWTAEQQITVAFQRGVATYPNLTALSCPAAGDCTAGGGFLLPSHVEEGFVAEEVNGRWDLGQQVRDVTRLGAQSTVTSVSCAVASYCTVGGTVTYDSHNDVLPFVAEEGDGGWSEAATFPDIDHLNSLGDDAAVTSVSCYTALDCSVAGYYSSGSGAFIADETYEWNIQVFTSTGGFTLNSVSCVSSGACGAGGTFTGSSGQLQAVVVNRTPRPTSTAMSLPVPKVSYGDEQAERVTVVVSAASGTPAGAVTVMAGPTTVCALTLTSGKGSCAPTARAFGPGTVRLTASYSGGGGDGPSVSAPRAFTVSKAASRTSLALSAAKVSYGHEQTEHLTVTVTPAFSGVPAGTVTVRTATATVCVITLTSGKGTCTLAARKLRAGTYQLTAAYPGDADFTGSVSAAQTLTVTG